MRNYQINLKKKYLKLGLKKSQILYITADFGKISDKRFLSKGLLNLHFKVIKSIIGTGGTIVVPTATLNLCNTKKVFDPKLTPSYKMGSFSEFIRTLRKAKRSIHPLWSISAVGHMADYFTKGISSHAFGYGSIWTKLINKNAMSLHIGVDPRKSISIVHYTELLAGVPYRFTKEFKQYIKINGKIKLLKFYHFCLKKDKKIKRDRNVKIYRNFENKFKPKKIKIQKGSVILFPLKEFYKINLEFLKKNPLAWLKNKI